MRPATSHIGLQCQVQHADGHRDKHSRAHGHLEVIFDQKPGYFLETENDQVMEKVDEIGTVVGFSVLCVSSLKTTPLEVSSP